MLVSCKCLNVTGFGNAADEHFLRRSRSGSVQFTDAAIPSGEEFEKQEGIGEFYCLYREFSRTATGPLQEFTETIAHTDLVYEVPLKQFFVKYCVNCKTITHAKNTLTSEIWVNSKLLTNPEKISQLKENPSFSKTFGILMMNSADTPSNKMQKVIFPTLNSSLSTTGNGAAAIINSNKISANGQAHVRKLTQHLDEQLQREYNDINEKISRYIEQQAAILDSYREKAKQEYQILVSLVNRVPDELKVINNTNEDFATETAITQQVTNIDNVPSLFTLKHQQQQLTSLDTPPATPDSIPMSIGNSPTFRQQTNIFGNIGGGGGSGRNSINSLNGSNGNTLDSDCLFELEGMENYPVSISTANMSDVEETEDAEDALGELEGMNIPRMCGRRPSLNIAKSLPISIAAVPETRSSMESLDAEIPEDRGVYIAASIQALARSVHGDTVFGDLPRPRFSTQI